MNTEWYEKVGVLTKRREKAQRYIEQWQQILDETEDQLRQLALESIQQEAVAQPTDQGEWTMVRSEQGA
jgi:ABC-type Fe3+-hydroxamate transport system substrate-binding protein